MVRAAALMPLVPGRLSVQANEASTCSQNAFFDSVAVFADRPVGYSPQMTLYFPLAIERTIARNAGGLPGKVVEHYTASRLSLR